MNVADIRADCHANYTGGWSGRECEAFHHGMDTVCNVIDRILAEAPTAKPGVVDAYQSAEPTIERLAVAIGAVALLRERLADVLQIEALVQPVDPHDEQLYHEERAAVTAAQAVLDATAEVR